MEEKEDAKSAYARAASELSDKVKSLKKAESTAKKAAKALKGESGGEEEPPCPHPN